LENSFNYEIIVSLSFIDIGT